MRDDKRIKVNGEWRELCCSDLAALMTGLGYSGESRGVAVAVNQELVPKSEWAERTLEPGDAVEIVSAVQGG